MQSGGNDITVIVRCKNEERYVGYALQSVNDILPKAKILVLDNESSDDSLDVVNSFRGRCDIRIETVVDYLPGKALNRGVELATTDFIILLSAHCLIREFDATQAGACVTAHGAAFGKQIPVWRGKKITPRYIWSHFGDDRVENMHSPIEGRPFFHNAFSLFARNSLLTHGFDEEVPGKEDRFWASRWIESGRKYVYLPSMVCEHHYTVNGATWKGVG
jgi:glycosyltransferase involved in cell wall biosynthesis